MVADLLTCWLIAAIETASLRHVRALLRRGASPSAPSADGTTPLYLASAMGQSELVRVLLEAGAVPDGESRGSEMAVGLPLCAAASWGHSDVVRELLAYDADPNRREDDGEGAPPLMLAAHGGHATTVKLLLEAKADPDAFCFGHTPLLAAAARGSVAIVQDLLSHGADPRITDELGRTAREVAREASRSALGSGIPHPATAPPWRGSAARFDVIVDRSLRAAGTELITVTAGSGSGGLRWKMRTGHAAIIVLLQECTPD